MDGLLDIREREHEKIYIGWKKQPTKRKNEKNKEKNVILKYIDGLSRSALCDGLFISMWSFF